MAQRNSGLHALLALPWVHTAYQWLLGSKRFQRRFADQFIRARDGDRLLDVGCGTGNLCRVLPDVEYVGYDANEAHIETARHTYGDRGKFHVGHVAAIPAADEQPFDLVLAVGLLHHLDDDEVHDFGDIARRRLRQGGRLVTIDPTFIDRQNWFAKWLIKRDRGMNVRRQEELLPLVTEQFPDVQAEIRGDLLRIPYTHLVLTATKAES